MPTGPAFHESVSRPQPMGEGRGFDRHGVSTAVSALHSQWQAENGEHGKWGSRPPRLRCTQLNKRSPPRAPLPPRLPSLPSRCCRAAGSAGALPDCRSARKGGKSLAPLRRVGRVLCQPLPTGGGASDIPISTQTSILRWQFKGQCLEPIHTHNKYIS